MGVKLGLST